MKKKNSKKAKKNRIRTKRTITVDPEVWDTLSSIAERQGRPISRILENLAKQYIEQEVDWSEDFTAA